MCVELIWVYLRVVVWSAASALLASLNSSESELDELQKLITEFSLLAPPPSLFVSIKVYAAAAPPAPITGLSLAASRAAAASGSIAAAKAGFVVMAPSVAILAPLACACSGWSVMLLYFVCTL